MSSYLNRTIVREEIPSRYLDAPRSVKVFLPPGYNELVTYPVMYCQDGVEFFTMGRIATIANQLILEEGLQPMIIVGVAVERSKRTSEYSAIGSKNPAYKRFFAEELIPYLEQKYPIRQTGSSRVIAGDSLGGTVSLHLALDYPELFPQVLSLSGAFFAPTLNRLREEADLSWLRVWMVVGTEETSVETHIGTFDFVEWNRLTRQELTVRNAQVTYLEQPGSHVWGFWQKVLPDGLRHFFPASPY